MISLIALALGAGTAASAHASFESACSTANGSPKTLASGARICRCGGLKKSIDPGNPDEAEACRNASYQPVVDQIMGFNSQSTCFDCPQDGYANNQNNSCGETLLGDMLAEDRKGSLSERVLNSVASAVLFQETGAWPTKPVVTAKTPGSAWFGVIDPSQKMCAQVRRETTNPWDLEKYLANDSHYRFGATGRVISQCFASASDDDKKRAIADYYYLNNRLREADLSALESIASIDSVLGDDFRKSFNGSCPDYLMKDRTAACDFYANKCRARGGLEPMVQQTKLALRTRDKLLSEISSLQQEDDAQMRMANSGIALRDYGTQIRAKESQLADLEAANPWIKGKAFNSTANYYKGGGRYQDGAVRDMIQKQLRQNRDSLIKRLDQYRQATSCLNKESDERAGRCKNFDKIIDDTPGLIFHGATRGNDRLSNLAEYYMGEAQCRWDVNNAAHMADRTVEDFTVGATLTVMTAGLGAAAGGAKLAVEGVSAAGGLSRAAVIGSTIFDTGFALNGGISAYQGCTQALYQTGKLATPSAGFEGGFSCPANPYHSAAAAPNVTANMQACVTRTIAAAANVLPFAPKVAHVLGAGEETATREAARETAEVSAPVHAPVPARALAAPVSRAAKPSFSAVTIDPAEIRGSDQVADTLSRFKTANQELKTAFRSSENPTQLLASLKKQIPAGQGLMRVVSPEEAQAIIKEGGMGSGYDFGMRPGDVRLGHGGNFIIARCSGCDSSSFAPGELGSSMVNRSKIPLNKLEFIVLQPGPARETAQEVTQAFKGIPPVENGMTRGFLASRKLGPEVTKKMGLPQDARLPIHYNVEQRKIAWNAGKIFENVPPSKLKPGAYSFVITADGNATYGLVENAWEVGVKHAHLANGRRVLSAGELVVGADGSVTYNLASGSFMNLADTPERIKATGDFFESQSGRPAKFTGSTETMFPMGSPTLEQVRNYCRGASFRSLNEPLCQKVLAP